jgi:Fe-S cluster assembly protein SufD
VPSFDADAVRALPGPPRLQRQREAAWERFTAVEFPTSSQEIWRYSRIDDFDLDRYRPVTPGVAPSLDELPDSLRALVAGLGEATVVVTGNGGAAAVHGVKPNFRVGPPEGDDSLNEGLRDEDAFDLLHDAFVGVPWVIDVPPGVAVERPVVIIHWVDGPGSAVFPHLRLSLGAGASAQVLEVVASSSDDAVLVVPVTEIVLGDGAHCSYGAIQVLGGNAWQIGRQVSHLGRDAALRSMTFSVGGHYARIRTDSVLAGQGGESELLAAYFGMSDQMHDLRTVQHHAAQRTRSDLLFKGAVANRAHSVYSGLIRVDKGAKGTNAFQTNRNLVLSEGAHADSVPNLEIEDNDVRCSHASAVGPIDEAQRFYLESRGVPTGVADRLISLGFVDDVLERFPVDGVHQWLARTLAERLDQAEEIERRMLVDQEDER